MTTAPTSAPTELGNVLRADVSRRVQRLQEGYLGNRGPAAQARAQADLAALRGCDPADPVAHPQAWAIVQDDTPDRIERIPKGGRADEPTPAERARHCALVLYAIHQQSRPLPMDVEGRSFAQAVRMLCARRAAPGEEFDTTTRRRFDQIMLSPTWAGRCEHLTSLVRLMRADDIGFDYGLLVRDLLRLSSPRDARGVRLAWGRDFYRRPQTVGGSEDNIQNDNEGVLK